MNEFRITPEKGLEFGLYTLGDHLPNPHTNERVSAKQRLEEIIEMSKLAEQDQHHLLRFDQTLYLTQQIPSCLHFLLQM